MARHREWKDKEMEYLNMAFWNIVHKGIPVAHAARNIKHCIPFRTEKAITNKLQIMLRHSRKQDEQNTRTES